MSKRENLSALSTLNFSGCVPSCKLEDLNPAFVEKLLFAQKYAGFQFTITSAFRSQAYERSKGRKGSSSHCKGLAVDISTREHSHPRRTRNGGVNATIINKVDDSIHDAIHLWNEIQGESEQHESCIDSEFGHKTLILCSMSVQSNTQLHELSVNIT